MNPNYINTYLTHRFPLIGTPDPRAPTINKDQVFINVFASERKSAEGSKFLLEQRAGLFYEYSLPTGVGRGVYFWNGSVFSVVDSVLYRGTTAIQTLSTSTGSVGFQEFANETNQNFLVVLDGTSGWVINSTFTVTKITDTDFPSPHCTKAAYIDGYLVVAKAGTADLYNSNLNDPLTWTTGDFISAEAMPDTVVALCRQNNYVVAIGTQTIEYFYDTGTFPGTPFARNDAAMHQIGCPAPDTLALVEGMTIYVGQTQTGGRTVWVSDGSSPSEVGMEPLRQSLAAEGTNIGNAKAFVVRSKGHKFYVLNLTSVTWVFDFDTQMWYQWADYTGANPFPCDYASDYNTGYPVLIDRSTGLVYTLRGTQSVDATSSSTTASFSCTVVTDKYDFGSMNHKFMHRFSLVGEVGNLTCTMYLSDDDYNTWSSGRVLPANQPMATVTQLGAFRRRAFKLVYVTDTPLRLEGFEVDINNGSK